MFITLAAAEAWVHDSDIETIRFHEVGAIDAILDITGAAICIDYLKPDRILSTAPELGARISTVKKAMLPIAVSRIDTSLGPVGLKTVMLPKNAVRYKIESQSIIDVAMAHHLDFEEARRLLRNEINEDFIKNRKENT